MVHMAADGETLVVVELEAKDIKEVDGTLTMMMMGDGIVAWQAGGADVMEEGDNAAALVRKVRGEGSHLLVDLEGMLCQSAFVTMVVMASGREVVALL